MDNDNSCFKISSSLNDYVDNNISSAKAIKIKNHIDQCSQCRLKYTNLMKVKEMVRTIFNSNNHSNYQMNISTKIMDKIDQTIEDKDNKVSLLKSSFNYKFLAVAAATIFMLAITIIYTQSENKKLMASQTKIDSYAIEHSSSGEVIELIQLTNSSVKTINYKK